MLPDCRRRATRYTPTAQRVVAPQCPRPGGEDAFGGEGPTHLSEEQGKALAAADRRGAQPMASATNFGQPFPPISPCATNAPSTWRWRSRTTSSSMAARVSTMGLGVRRARAQVVVLSRARGGRGGGFQGIRLARARLVLPRGGRRSGAPDGDARRASRSRCAWRSRSLLPLSELIDGSD